MDYRITTKQNKASYSEGMKRSIQVQPTVTFLGVTFPAGKKEIVPYNALIHEPLKNIKIIDAMLDNKSKITKLVALGMADMRQSDPSYLHTEHDALQKHIIGEMFDRTYDDVKNDPNYGADIAESVHKSTFDVYTRSKFLRKRLSRKRNDDMTFEKYLEKRRETYSISA